MFIAGVSQIYTEIHTEISPPYMDDGSLHKLILQPNIVQSRSDIQDICNSIIKVKNNKIYISLIVID